GEQEHHRRAVRGEDLVVAIGAEQGVLGASELGAHQRRLDPTGEKHEKSGNDVPPPDRLVIDGGEPSPESRPIPPRRVERRRVPRQLRLAQRQDHRKRRAVRAICTVWRHLSVSRYETSELSCASLSGIAGMWTPGLIAFGSRIQRVRFARVLASVPAASVARLLKCVSPGPMVARASVPPIVWQSAQPLLMNTRRPAMSPESVGGAGGVEAAASQAMNFARGSAMM